MDLLTPALQGAVRAAPPPATARASLLVLGAGGALGSLVLEQALACGRFASVGALVRAPLASTLRGLHPWFWPEPEQVPTSLAAATTALMVFERERRSNGRDDAFVLPDPADLLRWARALAGAGSTRLVVVVPHAPSMLPGALKRGFASEQEQALARLGFEQLLILRPAQATSASVDDAAPWLERFAAWWLGQLRWMVPEGERPVRAVRLAQLVVELVHLLDGAAPGTRVVPPEVLAQAAAAGDAEGGSSARLRDWLDGRPVAT